MPEPSAGLAAKNAWQRMRRLLFPFRPGRWLAVYGSQAGKSAGQDPLIAELRRIRPYYRGTRLVTAAGLLLIAAAFVLPFSVIFVGMETFMLLLLAYVVVLIAVSIAGMAAQSGLDAVFAIRHERKTAFRKALKVYLSLLRTRSDLTLGYMSIKLAVDFLVSTLAIAFFLPALLAAMYVMITVTNAVLDRIDPGPMPYVGLIVVVLLAFLGFVATLLLTLPATAFYGYYTEEAVRMMQEAPCEAIHPPEESRHGDRERQAI
ncbi:MAG: hypothetical protein A4E28_03030 [Methanocella sp. PtaU1.Bin125]|nr:MAG: hypothetical protein A4E28_03030 [Methanocella sp. PtaU1.Bin125]